MDTGSNWLTAKRLTAHGLLLGVALWAIYIWTLATPGLRDRNGNLKGTDFLHLYTLGWIARAHDGGHLYDMAYQAGTAVSHVPQALGIRYLPLYPPQVSLIFAPFAAVGYAHALALWWAVSGAIYCLCCYAIWRHCPRLDGYRYVVLVLAIAFPGFFNLIAWGQTSALALACFTGTFLLLRQRREFLAGLVLGCLIYKPQLGMAAAVVFLATGSWKIVAGAIAGSVFELGAAALYYGTGSIRDWMSTLLQVRSVLPLLEPRPYQTHCLRTFWSMMLPWQGLAFGMYVISAGLVLALTIWIWQRGEVGPLRYSALLLATVLVSPHLTVYDLVILAPAILLLADWALGQPRSMQYRVGTLLYLAYALPLLAPLTRWTHIQLSVIVMVTLVFVIWGVCQKSSGISETGNLSNSGIALHRG